MSCTGSVDSHPFFADAGEQGSLALLAADHVVRAQRAGDARRLPVMDASYLRQQFAEVEAAPALQSGGRLFWIAEKPEAALVHQQLETVAPVRPFLQDFQAAGRRSEELFLKHHPTAANDELCPSRSFLIGRRRQLHF